jgi:protein-tyrosine phosphatase
MPAPPGAAMDANQILPRLWQGADPPGGPLLKQMGVQVLVLCAAECQHPRHLFPGVQVIYAPMRDTSDVPLGVALSTAARVAALHRKGARIMVCCAQGINRSGLITGLAVRLLTGMSGRRALHHVQGRRRGALRNDAFAAYLATLPPSAAPRVPVKADRPLVYGPDGRLVN